MWTKNLNSVILVITTHKMLERMFEGTSTQVEIKRDKHSSQILQQQNNTTQVGHHGFKN